TVIIVCEELLGARAIAVEIEFGVDIDPAIADTATSEEIEPVGRTEVGKSVRHQALHGKVAVEFPAGLNTRSDWIEIYRHAVDAVDANAFVGGLTFEAKPAEVVSD